MEASHIRPTHTFAMRMASGTPMAPVVAMQAVGCVPSLGAAGLAKPLRRTKRGNTMRTGKLVRAGAHTCCHQFHRARHSNPLYSNPPAPRAAPNRRIIGHQCLNEVMERAVPLTAHNCEATNKHPQPLLRCTQTGGRQDITSHPVGHKGP
jgi:hypothetical protein